MTLNTDLLVHCQLRNLTLLLVTLSIIASHPCCAFNIPVFSATLTAPTKSSTGVLEDISPELTTPLKSVVTKVAVPGATGRTGQLVIQELIDRGVPNVVAIVRDAKKANKLFSETKTAATNLDIVECDLGDRKQIIRSLNGCDATIWCATGFSDSPTTGPFEKMKRLFGLAMLPQKSIDVVALPAIAEYFVTVEKEKVNGSQSSQSLPKIVMCSSAGVTRPGWDEAKKTKYPGSADIPIVRLNPFNILERKFESEEKLRASGVDYCIVRPTGLNDNWPSGSRPLLTQGDVAVGRNNRKDLAKLLVDVLMYPEATNKTFEMVSIAGYARPRSLGPALARLQKDGHNYQLSEESIDASYAIMQQLLPGEQQDSAALAMGQTYEQLDTGTTGRLGQRGSENMEAVGLRPSS